MLRYLNLTVGVHGPIELTLSLFLSLQFKEMIHTTRKDMAEKLSGMQILDNSNPQKPVVRMANLCVVSSHTVSLPLLKESSLIHLL